MNVNDLFPSKYLSAADLQGQEFRLTIQDIYLGTLDNDEGGQQQKPVVRFANAKKEMVLNKTNASAIAASYGDDTAGWVGRDIILFSMMVDFKGRQMAGLRVRIPSDTAAQQQPAPQQPAQQQPAQPAQQQQPTAAAAAASIGGPSAAQTAAANSAASVDDIPF